MSERFSGQLALVAGGTGGLGSAISVAFLEEGATVVVTYRRQAEFDALLRATGAYGSRLNGHNIDVTDEAAVNQIMRPPTSPRSRVWFIGSSEQNRQVDFYRWEFVRRNPEFVSDYDRFAASFGDWLKGQELEFDKWTDQDKELFHSKVEPMLIELYRKWQIDELFPPELDREDAITASENGDQRIIPLDWWCGGSA